MSKILLTFFLTFLSYGATPDSTYNFKTIDKKTGSLAEPLRKVLILLDISSKLSSSQALTLLQEKYGRKLDQERYQLSANKDLENRKKLLLTPLKQLSMVGPVFPSSSTYDVIVILGATIGSMQERVAFLNELIRTNKILLHPHTQLFIITGDRELFPYEDITQSNTQTFRQGWEAPASDKLPKTEGEAASLILDQLIEDSALRTRVKVLISPKRYDESTKKWVRPHTGNTIETLLEKINNPNNKKFLFISNNPYIAYQHAVISREFLDRTFKNSIIETVGSRAAEETEVVQFIDNLRNTLQRELEVWERVR